MKPRPRLAIPILPKRFFSDGLYQRFRFGLTGAKRAGDERGTGSGDELAALHGVIGGEGKERNEVNLVS